ncbi:radical SAM protein [Serratia marcescens]|uniref:radical SAM protein n=2 Tax=Serratia TaxID=613 RepID=UPI0018D9C2EB|nr:MULTISPECIES: radical SAM protein [Serratia]MBH2762814.1 radical SAM protein [Serratia marcescens]MBH3102389.1 radical SAM protein [Serratia marcescens]MBN5242263.1 radical SAM protein [Serratia marcescens]MCW7607754.1 radical SAM protein [Serratia bockelmannii]WPJ25714.1 hypothetical protein NAE95_09330 [Serratia marcescens]
MKKPYKYYSGITSQISFCATPLRLDSYNNCSFGCTYCYARTRQGHGREQQLQISNPQSLHDRLKRVSDGIIKSSLDEFIQRKIPFQLGGMSDPFSRYEQRAEITLEYMKILREYDYPYIISTKSALISTSKYKDALLNSNSYVRFSTTVIDAKKRKLIDKGCVGIDNLAEAAQILSTINIPTSFRLQPIIPGFESFAEEIINIAAESGVKHLSAEYLKVPMDANKKFGSNLLKIFDNTPVSKYISMGAHKVGREYTLPLEYRTTYLIEMYQYTKAKGMTFGFADNDLLLHADGASCCGASDLYLREANFFHANIPSIIKKKKINEEIYFIDFLTEWIPQRVISTYLNSKARLAIIDTSEPEWLQFLKKMWVGEQGVYNPLYFDGVSLSGKLDSNGLPIYIRTLSSFEKKLRSY